MTIEKAQTEDSIGVHIFDLQKDDPEYWDKTCNWVRKARNHRKLRRGFNYALSVTTGSAIVGLFGAGISAGLTKSDQDKLIAVYTDLSQPREENDTEMWLGDVVFTLTNGKVDTVHCADLTALDNAIDSGDSDNEYRVVGTYLNHRSTVTESPLIVLDPVICESFDLSGGGDGAFEVALRVAEATFVVAHEVEHANDETANEAETNCAGLEIYEETARQLGTTEIIFGIPPIFVARNIGSEEYHLLGC